jgi:glycerophosphoryl diester phosphodiesterase
MSVNAWTVNKEKDMKVMYQLGVDQITTNFPLVARKVLEDMGYIELR